MNIEQIQEMARQLETKLRQVDAMITRMEAVPEDADAAQIVRAMLDVQLQMLKDNRSELQARLNLLRPALANIIIAAPAPGGRQ